MESPKTDPSTSFNFEQIWEMIVDIIKYIEWTIAICPLNEDAEGRSIEDAGMSRVEEFQQNIGGPDVTMRTYLEPIIDSFRTMLVSRIETDVRNCMPSLGKVSERKIKALLKRMISGTWKRRFAVSNKRYECIIFDELSETDDLDQTITELTFTICMNNGCGHDDSSDNTTGGAAT